MWKATTAVEGLLVLWHLTLFPGSPLHQGTPGLQGSAQRMHGALLHAARAAIHVFLQQGLQLLQMSAAHQHQRRCVLRAQPVRLEAALCGFDQATQTDAPCALLFRRQAMLLAWAPALQSCTHARLVCTQLRDSTITQLQCQLLESVTAWASKGGVLVLLSGCSRQLRCQAMVRWDQQDVLQLQVISTDVALVVLAS